MPRTSVSRTLGERQGLMNVRDIQRRSARGASDVRDVRKSDVRDISVRDMKSAQGASDIKDVRNSDVRDIKGVKDRKSGGMRAIRCGGGTRWINSRGVDW